MVERLQVAHAVEIGLILGPALPPTRERINKKYLWVKIAQRQAILIVMDCSTAIDRSYSESNKKGTGIWRNPAVTA
jgi:hypothetical protein